MDWGLKRFHQMPEDPELGAPRREGLLLSEYRALPNAAGSDERVLYGPAHKIQVLRNDPETGWARPVWEYAPLESRDRTASAKALETFYYNGIQVPKGALTERTSQVYLDNPTKFD